MRRRDIRWKIDHPIKPLETGWIVENRNEGLVMYHYTDCGLDNVYLVNGFVPHKTPYGDGYSIQDTKGLHEAIGRWLVSLPKVLNGAELRFLRLEMEITQRDTAGMLGSSEQNVRRWEAKRAGAIPGPADRLLRALYAEYLDGDGSVRRMVERLATLDTIKHAKAQLRETDHGWITELFDMDEPAPANDDCRDCTPAIA